MADLSDRQAATARSAIGRRRETVAPTLAPRPQDVAIAATTAFLVLLALNLSAIFVRATSDSRFFNMVARMFVFDEEANIPTLFNFALLVGVAVLLAHLGLRAISRRDRWRRHWLGLAAVFLYLAYDEAAQLHEELMPIFNRLVDASGILYFSWVIPGAAFVLVMGLAYCRFVLALPPDTRSLTILGGSLYIGGALGTELIGADYASQYGMATPGYHLIPTVEESLEMLGLILFGYALLRLLAGPDGRVRLLPAA